MRADLRSCAHTRVPQLRLRGLERFTEITE
jgi:hypothetical protein